MVVGTLPHPVIRWQHAGMGDDQDRERAAAFAAFRERQRPPSSFAPRRTEETDPVGVLAVAMLCFVVLAIVGALLVGSEHVVLGVLVYLGMVISGLVALIAGVAAGVEWGMRRSRQRQAASGPE
jgi:hypothetical protein